MKGLVTIIYIALSITQFLAFLAGLQVWFGINIVFAVIIALLLGGIPLLGTIAGMCGAVYGWGWSWFAAIGLFFGWFFIVVILSIVGSMMEKRELT